MTSHTERRWKPNTVIGILKRLTPFLAFVAAISGLAAAAGAFWAAHETRRAANASIEALALEMSPALQLDCNLDHLGRFPTVPTEALFLKRGENVQVQLSQVSTYGSDGRLFTIPHIFFRCRLTNYGKMPAFDITIHFPVEFENLNESGAKQDLAFYNMPALSSGASHEFAIAGWDTQFYARVIAPQTVRFVTMTQVQEQQHKLFLSRWAFGIGSGQLPPGPSQPGKHQ